MIIRKEFLHDQKNPGIEKISKENRQKVTATARWWCGSDKKKEEEMRVATRAEEKKNEKNRRWQKNKGRWKWWCKVVAMVMYGAAKG